MDGPPIPWGCLRILGDQVVAVGTLEALATDKNEPIRDFTDSVLMPGLINAHCHLELGMIRGMLPRGEAFPLWVSRLRKALTGMQPDKYRQAARLGILDCLKNGTTTVVDVGNTGESMHELAALPIRSFSYLEMIGLDPDTALDRLREMGEKVKSLPPGTALFQPGVTCHAPYSCSVELLRRITQDPELRNQPFTLHVSESAEEMALFGEGRGALLDFCRRIYPAFDSGAAASPIGYLKRNGLIPQGSILAHCNHTDEQDIRILADTETSVVHCPRSKSFFNHGGFHPERLRAAGINLCLGTDSLASNESLSLFDEMAELHRCHPEIPCRDILAMATLNGARALGRSGDLGSLKPGAKADFIAISLRHHPEYDLYEEIVSEAHEVVLVSVAGEEVVS